MRGTRWLLLVAIAAILGGIVIIYRAQKRESLRQAIAKPSPLPDALSSSADDFEFNKQNGSAPCPAYHISAHRFEQSSDSSHVDLTNLQLKIYNKSCTGYNLAK